jgi:hypothetical protein
MPTKMMKAEQSHEDSWLGLPQDGGKEEKLTETEQNRYLQDFGLVYQMQEVLELAPIVPHPRTTLKP